MEGNITALINIARKEVEKRGYSEFVTNFVYILAFDIIEKWYDKNDIIDFSFEHFEDFIIQNFRSKVNFEKFTDRQQEYYRCFSILNDIKNNNPLRDKYNYHQNIKLDDNYKELLENYLSYNHKSGIGKETLKGRKTIGIKFLSMISTKKLSDFSDINYEIIVEFIQSLNYLSKRSLATNLSHLRTFLIYLYENKYCSKNLAILLPTIKKTNHSRIPSIWDFDDVKKLLNCIDKSTAAGKRDYAIILLALTTSMRGIDIVNINFKNFNWDSNEIRFIQSKTKVEVIIPLLESTKVAILNYIKNARPKCELNNIFISLRPPYQKLDNGSSLTKMLYKYLRIISSELKIKQKRGIHSFRHTVINTLFNDNETSINTLAEISGHCNLDSLNSYIKTDIERLKECTLSLEDFWCK